MPTICLSISSAAGIWRWNNSDTDTVSCMSRRVRGFSTMVNYRRRPAARNRFLGLNDAVPCASTSLRARLLRHDVQFQFFGASNDDQARSNPDLRAGQQFVQRIDAGDRLSAEFNDHVPFTKPGPLRRTVRFDGEHQHAALDGQMVVADHAAVQLDVLPGQADVTAPDLALFDEPAGDVFRGVDRDGKTDSL